MSFDEKRLIFNSFHLNITVSRLCQQLIENHNNFEESVILGLQPRGIFLAERIKSKLLEEDLIKKIDLGYLDPTFYRDDFRRREILVPNANRVNFIVEDKRVILIDDVLYTGRTVRSALDAMLAYGRPKQVELLVLIDRKYDRDLPIQPNYVGRQVNAMQSEKILVELKEQGVGEDNIWLVNIKEK
jgi:pyrimidine operon attenuation protein / uracil phosphoribosyltransferase